MCVSIEELTEHVVGTAALTRQIVGTVAEQASKTVRFAGHDGQVGRGGRVGAEELDHIGGTGKGGIGELEQRKLEERHGVGGIETRGLHMVDRTDPTAELDGYWKGNQFMQVCGGFNFDGIGLCEDVEGELFDSFW